jgi:outer membrane protein assembly factor BamE (lipoprotein component of BamABCDE complex)
MVKNLFVCSLLLLFICGCSTQPKIAQEIYGLKLGMTKSEIRNIKGDPPLELLKPEVFKVFDKMGIWNYDTPKEKEGLFIQFDKDDLLCWIHLSDPSVKSDLSTIKIGSTSNDVLWVFGKPSKKEPLHNAVRWVYPKYNVAFVIEYDKVQALIVADFNKTLKISALMRKKEKQK